MRFISSSSLCAIILAQSCSALVLPLSATTTSSTASSSVSTASSTSASTSVASSSPLPSISSSSFSSSQSSSATSSSSSTSSSVSSSPSSTVASSTASSTSSTSSSSSASDTPTGLSIAASLGIPPLTADDINFIVSGEMWDQANLTDEKPAGNDTLTRRENIATGADTPEKWNALQMDLWLEGWVNTRNVTLKDGTVIKLKDSTSFLKDFWMSTGEQSNFRCDKISEVCDPLDSKDKAFKGIEEEDRLRAYMVRSAISIWKQELKDAFELFTWASSNAQGMIKEMREAFTEPDATKPGDPMEVVMAAIAVAGVAFPALAPAAGAIGGIYALNKAISSRDTEGDVLAINDVLKTSLSEGSDSELLYTESGIPHYSEPAILDQRAKGTLWGNINTLKEKVAALEAKGKKSEIETLNGATKTAGDLMDKSAKIIVAFKALNPGLPKSKIDSWTFFDSRIKTIFDSYTAAVEDGYNLNQVTWGNKASKSRENVEVGASGMQEILSGGVWFKVSAGNDHPDVTGQRESLMAFYRKIVFMEVLKAQGIYLWRQHFDSEADCKSALNDYKSKDLISEVSNQCVQKGSGPGSWHLRIARRPKTYDGHSGEYLAPVDFVLKWNRYLVKLGTNTAENKAYTQQISEYRKNSAGLTKYTEAYLSAAKLGVTRNDIFDYAEKCQEAMGVDPFKLDAPTRDDIYPPMGFNGLDTMSSSDLPLCLFDLPIIDINDSQLAAWCKDNVGETAYSSGMHRKALGYRPVDEICASLENWAALGDAKVCVEQSKNWKAKDVAPGCEGHDKGWFYMSIKEKSS